jgi:hypothetical protein
MYQINVSFHTLSWQHPDTQHVLPPPRSSRLQLEHLMPLLHTLRGRNMMPALLFNFDRACVGVVAGFGVLAAWAHLTERSNPKNLQPQAVV